MFAKAGALSALIDIAGSDKLGMTPAVAEEIMTPLQYGYQFPREVLARIPVVPLSAAVIDERIRLQNVAVLGRGEREAIAFCKIEQALFATNDAKAGTFARAQQNNHATSEAAALFVGGAWLLKYGATAQQRRQGAAWRHQGRRMLESVVPHLVMADGSFSQYSVTYHRLLLDTLSHTELWRRWLDEAPFSDRVYERAGAAIDWLTAFVDPVTGGAPNLGSNDGAWPLRLASTDYRDFRPSIALAEGVFRGGTRYGPGPWQEPLIWLGVEVNGTERDLSEIRHRNFADGGYARLGSSRQDCFVIIRYPRHRFRPGHADPLHLDLWCHGVNLLRDGGSYSYAAEDDLRHYFKGIASHNTVQFDDREPMPRLGRFLYGNWIEAEGVTGPWDEQDGSVHWRGEYRDAWGAFHHRSVSFDSGRLKVTDQLGGFEQKAVLRWRLAPELSWQPVVNGCTSEMATLVVQSDVSIVRCDMVEGWESRYYLERTPLAVLEVEVSPKNTPITLTTELDLKVDP